MRIGIVKLSSLGDVIHALPVAHALREALPTAHLTWVVEAREQAILEGNRDLDSLIPVDTRRWRRRLGSVSGLLHVLHRAREIRQSLIAAKFDVVLDLQGLLKSGLITGFSGATLRIGFSLGYCRESLNVCFTNHRVTPPPSARHVVEQYLSLLSPLQVIPGRVVFSIPTNVVLERRMDDFLSGYGVKAHEPVVALNPGAGRQEKRWPLASYRDLAQRLNGETGAKILLLWGPGEDQLAKAIREGSAIQPVLAPRTTLPEMAALLRRCRLVIGSDTGPIHLAAALGVGTIGLYGPTSAVRNGPYGEHARSIQSRTGSMEGITVDSVTETALECLASERVCHVSGIEHVARYE
jgi:lipopolysaccharide heptosyltransferase I